MEKYPYGYCGMPCALCPRYRTDGKSRCLGCSAGGYYTDVCKVYHCCRDKALEHCGACGGFPCVRLGKMGDFRDLDTGHVKQRTCAMVSESGFDAWYSEYEQKAELLMFALEKYNNGRMKRFICELFIKQSLDNLRYIMKKAEEINCENAEKYALFRKIADEVSEK